MYLLPISNQKINVLTNFTKFFITSFYPAFLGLHYVGKQVGIVVLKGIFLQLFIVNMFQRNATLLS